AVPSSSTLEQSRSFTADFPPTKQPPALEEAHLTIQDLAVLLVPPPARTFTTGAEWSSWS
ncbi:MAG: hypothetical protein WCK27_30655, partial [Verrucomicrobiota bacterium]